MRKYHRGISLLELILALTIVIVILVMTTRFYLYAHRSENTNKGLTLTQAVVAGAENYRADHLDYTGLSAEVLCKQGSLPDHHCANANTPLDPWGGSLSVTSKSDSFIVSMEKVPAKVCENLKNKFQNEAATCSKGKGDVTFTVKLGGH